MTALEELRENLRKAAQRDIDAHRVRSRRRRRRTTGLVVLALLGGAAAASATDLISVGKPLRQPANRTTAYAPDGGTKMQVALTAPSGAALPYGVVTYTAKNGERCAVAGFIRGTQIGLVQGDKFRPYAVDYTGACRKGKRLFYDSIVIGDRVLLFGRARPATRRISVPGLASGVPVAKGGAFLFVADKSLRPRLVVHEE